MPYPRFFRILSITIVGGLAVDVVPSSTSASITIDASVAPAPPAALPFAVGGKAPDGRVFSINNRYFTLDGQPWFPVMGEFHYSRYPANEWESEILKMKAGGINVVSTYVFWIFHEEIQGKFDWSGQRDLRQFIELCAKHGLYVWARIGPWDHGEVRNGGFPDWLDKTGSRSNDPGYLGHVQSFYGEIGRQLKGLFWKEGGPIIGVQIENEYHPRTGGIAHMEQLLQMARAAGLDAPFYTATGWDNTAFPPAGFLPVFGGYTEQFWSNSLKELPPNQNFFFTTIRAEDNVMGDLQPKNPGYNTKYADFPFLTAEMGGGMAIAYHRRPIMYGDDSTAAALVKLGAGITGLGYYMYHGGTNPDGQTPETLTSLQEKQAVWNGYNDMEAKSYDFQAPLGEFGQVNPAYRAMKALHLFLNDFGSQLAPMAVYFPSQLPKSTSDTATPRVALRSDGKSGFIFINNYERNYPLDEHKDFQVSVKLPSESLQIPRQPMVVPSGVYTIWPVNFDLGGATLQYATAELLCKISSPETYVFFAWPGMKTEFSIQDADGATIEAPHAQITRAGGHAYINGIAPGADVAIRINYQGGKSAQIIVLTRDQGLNLWKAKIAGGERLFLSAAGLYFDGDKVHLSARNTRDLRLGIFPALIGSFAGFNGAPSEGVFQEYFAEINESKIAADVKPTKPAIASEPAKMSRRNVAIEPEDADFARAAVWSIHVPPAALAGSNRALLVIKYEGDVARLYAGDRFVDDNFYKGTPWEIGLWRFTPQQIEHGFDLKILPMRADTKVFLEKSARLAFPDNADVLNVKDVSVVWEYNAVFNAGK